MNVRRDVVVVNVLCTTTTILGEGLSEYAVKIQMASLTTKTGLLPWGTFGDASELSGML
jgi:hypothetical protein